MWPCISQNFSSHIETCPHHQPYSFPKKRSIV
uniref:Uncharacterized protein n=1 Tax=Rhizophora mucronata TaxID=61149 RepID=A0A2P2PEW6_RHIMU